MKKTWTCIEISCDAEYSEEVAARVAAAFEVGVEITDQSIRFYLEGEVFPQHWANDLHRLLEEIRKSKVLKSSLKWSYSFIRDSGWAERWKENFKPLRVGKHLIVSPTWEEANAKTDDIVIRIDPGMAFGTGHHETTRLCLEWLEEWASCRHDVACRSLLDVGTGSGILAIAAGFLGYESVVGMDTDPEAIEVAQENLRINGLEKKVKLEIGAVKGSEYFDEILANIQAKPLIDMAPILTGCLKKAGRLVLSGILLEQKGRVRAVYETHGLQIVSERVDGEWCLLVFGLSNEVFRNDESTN